MREIEPVRHPEVFETLTTALEEGVASPVLQQAAAIQLRRMREALNTPMLEPFAEAVLAEAKHQRARWGDAHDDGKSPWDWFWTLAHLASKAVHAVVADDMDKALHHTISSAALLANWHRRLSQRRAEKIARLHDDIVKPATPDEEAPPPYKPAPEDRLHGTTSREECHRRALQEIING